MILVSMLSLKFFFLLTIFSVQSGIIGPFLEPIILN